MQAVTPFSILLSVDEQPTNNRKMGRMIKITLGILFIDFTHVLPVE
jgi:hypothetical protein